MKKPVLWIALLIVVGLAIGGYMYFTRTTEHAAPYRIT
jgi:hypothetical protein